MSELRQTGLSGVSLQKCDLFSLEEDIVKYVDEFLSSCGSSVILDITSLPKRFFFPFTRRIIGSPRVKNFLVAYSLAKRYHSGPLAEDHASLAPLPLFRNNLVPEPKVELAVIGVGYMPLGLADFLEKYKHDVDIRALLPLPTSPDSFQRNWRFVNALSRDYPRAVENPTRVDGTDVSDVFDHIASMTSGGKIKAEFGPFGPKPMSLAMCLFSVLAGDVVRYTQPRIYHPEYSKGVESYNGEPAINTYCVRLNGSDLYQL